MTRERTPVRPSYRVAIMTTYHGPTDTRGSYIRAHWSDHTFPHPITRGYDHTLDGPDNHAYAAMELANHAKSLGGIPERAYLVSAATKRGYVFIVIDPEMDR